MSISTPTVSLFQTGQKPLFAGQHVKPKSFKPFFRREKTAERLNEELMQGKIEHYAQKLAKGPVTLLDGPLKTVRDGFEDYTYLFRFNGEQDMMDFSVTKRLKDGKLIMRRIAFTDKPGDLYHLTDMLSLRDVKVEGREPQLAYSRTIYTSNRPVSENRQTMGKMERFFNALTRELDRQVVRSQYP